MMGVVFWEEVGDESYCFYLQIVNCCMYIKYKLLKSSGS